MYRYVQRYMQDAFTMATPPFYISETGHGNERNLTAFGAIILEFWSKGEFMKRNVVSFRCNVRLARQLWGEPSRMAFNSLRHLTARYSLSVAEGDLQFLDGRWYVTHAGLLRIARRRGCAGIRTSVEHHLSDPNSHRWI